MSTRTALIAASRPAETGIWLIPLLSNLGFGTHTLDLAQLAARFRDSVADDDASLGEAQDLPRHDLLILVPAIDGGRQLSDDMAHASNTLAACFALIKGSLAGFEAAGSNGRIFSLLEVDAVMGDTESTASAAVAGGMLSLFRTIALELKKTPVTVNTIILSADRTNSKHVEVPGAAGVAAMIASLCSADARAINGQEIYAAGAVDIGRLHP